MDTVGRVKLLELDRGRGAVGSSNYFTFQGSALATQWASLLGMLNPTGYAKVGDLKEHPPAPEVLRTIASDIYRQWYEAEDLVRQHVKVHGEHAQKGKFLEVLGRDKRNGSFKFGFRTQRQQYARKVEGSLFMTTRGLNNSKTLEQLEIHEGAKLTSGHQDYINGQLKKEANGKFTLSLTGYRYYLSGDRKDVPEMIHSGALAQFTEAELIEMLRYRESSPKAVSPISAS